MLAFRGPDNHTVQYTTAPASTITSTPTHAHDSDSDGQPLIACQVDEESAVLQNFTATGRPMPVFKQSALQSMGGADMFSLPQLLPRQYTDDSIIPAIVTNVIRGNGGGKKEGGDEKEGSGNGDGDRNGRRKSFLGKLRGEGRKKNGSGEKEGVLKVKVVFMPRREYKKFFARGVQGEYVGSEPERSWTEEELDEMFGMYRPPKVEKKGYIPPS